MCTMMSIRFGGSSVRSASMRSSDVDLPSARRIWNPERWPAFCVTCTSWTASMKSAGAGAKVIGPKRICSVTPLGMRHPRAATN